MDVIDTMTAPLPLDQIHEEAWRFWRDVLKSPKHVMAPMVDGSDLAYRLLSRRYNTHLTFTPMIHSKAFNKSRKNQKHVLTFDPTDRPLILQFGGSTAEELLEAALVAQEYDTIDAIDVNFGCPQLCAKQGGYGAYLLDEPDEMCRILRTLKARIKLPITCKIRIYDDVAKTVELAKRLEACGIAMLTVHGRTRDQRGKNMGLCSWEAIRQVKEALGIPVISNGGLRTFDDIDLALEATGADAVMSAEAMLWNPAFFSNTVVDPCDLIIEYIDIFRNNPERTRKALNSHVFEILRARFDRFPEFRARYKIRLDYDKMIQVFLELKEAVLAADSAARTTSETVALVTVAEPPEAVAQL